MRIAGMCKVVKAWRESKGFETTWHNVPLKLMLIVTELAEAMEAYRHFGKASLDSLQRGGGVKIPFLVDGADEAVELLDTIYENFQEELADTFIRLFDLCGSLDIDIERAIEEKMAKNAKRPALHGKQR